MLLNVLSRLPPWSSLRARSVKSFCDFRKMTCRDLTAFSPFWHEKILFFKYSYVKSTKAYLCPNIINFDTVDVMWASPWRSDEFLLTLSLFVAFIIGRYCENFEIYIQNSGMWVGTKKIWKLVQHKQFISMEITVLCN